MISEDRLRAWAKVNAPGTYMLPEYLFSPVQWVEGDFYRMDTIGHFAAADFARELLEWREVGRNVEWVEIYSGYPMCPMCERTRYGAGRIHAENCKLARLLGRVAHEPLGP